MVAWTTHPDRRGIHAIDGQDARANRCIWGIAQNGAA